jgi:hypothetical protein
MKLVTTALHHDAQVRDFQMFVVDTANRTTRQTTRGS